jgi:nucleoside 2-deoxyribosyltransferase
LVQLAAQRASFRRYSTTGRFFQGGTLRRVRRPYKLRSHHIKINLDVVLGSDHYVFAYAHPLSVPDCYVSGPLTIKPRIEIKDNVILLFGALEGLPSISADKLIIDPQGEDLLTILDSNLIKAREIAIVANEREIMVCEKPIRQCVKVIFKRYPRVASIVAKRGPFGALAFDRRYIHQIPAYEAERVFKIGSGDVFSAVFSFMWAVREEGISSAADFASRAVAYYVNDPYLNFTEKKLGNARPLAQRRKTAQIYLAGPFFTMADFLILAEARRATSELGAEVFSPFHHVGFGENSVVAKKDLRALTRSECVLALLHNCDPGTIFELGYARAQGIPVVAVAENVKPSDLTMLLGSGCVLEHDFCTAVYKSIWTAFRGY